MAKPVDALISGVSEETRADSNSVIRTIEEKKADLGSLLFFGQIEQNDAKKIESFNFFQVPWFDLNCEFPQLLRKSLKVTIQINCDALLMRDCVKTDHELDPVNISFMAKDRKKVG